jgi:RND family efflux transporter MFP subunit
MSVLSKRKKYVWVIVIVLIIGGYYYYKSKQTNNNQVQYVTATAAKGTLTSSVSASGNVVVDQSTNIDPTITGTVSNLAVNVGDKIKKGQILFTIVNDQLGVSVAQANSSYVSAQGQILSAQVQLKSAKAQKESADSSLKSDQKKNKTTPGTVNHEGIDADKKDISAAQASVDSAEAAIISAQAGLKSQSSNLGYQQEQAGKRNVVSIIDGTVNAVNIKNGDDLSKLSSGSSRQVPIIIGDLGTMKAQVQVNEVDVANVSIGQKVMMKMDALNNFETTGVVEKMDSLGTLTSGVVTYNVTIDFDSLDPRIKPEMSVSASIITDVKQDVITVPSSAVKIQNGTNYVEVLNGATPEQKNVTVGVSNSTDTEIVSGINVGDKVVTQTINSSSASSASTSSTSRTGGSSSGGLRLPGLSGGGGGRPAGD